MNLYASIGQLNNSNPTGTKIIDATGMLLIPGVIDDQVHFGNPD